MKTTLRPFFAALSLLFVCSSGLLAQTNVTWTGAVDNTWENAGNWTTSTVPNATDAVATFGGTGSTSLSLSTTIDLDQLSYQSGAQAYTIGIAAAGRLNLNGAGSVNASTSPQTITVGGSDLNGYAGWLSFQNSASAGTGTYVGYGSTQSYGATPTSGGGGQISFSDTSTAGTATFTVNGASVASSDGSQLMFHGSSTAANATFTTTGSGFSGGQVYFWDTATAGSSTITNEKSGQTYFFGNSTAGTATITASGGTADNRNAGYVYFFGGTADHAIITANGGTDGGYGSSINFYGGTAGNATVTANGGTNGGYGSYVYFNGGALGDTATFKINSGATMDISGHESTSALTIGSLEGGGNVSLGARSLIVGSNNTSTTFSGVIDDAGNGGSLGKTGTGSFRLTAANTYSGGTTVGSGTLVASGGYSVGGSSLGTGGVTVNGGGTLAGNDFIVGAATINSGGHLAPGDPGAGGTGVLRFDGGLTLMGGSQVDIRLTNAAPTFVMVNGGAFSATDGIVAFNFTSGGFSASTLYTLVDFTNATSHDFTDLTHFTIGSVETGTTADYTLELNGSILQVMTSSAIPEPSTYAAFAGLCALGLVFAQRRRRTA